MKLLRKNQLDAQLQTTIEIALDEMENQHEQRLRRESEQARPQLRLLKTRRRHKAGGLRKGQSLPDNARSEDEESKRLRSESSAIGQASICTGHFGFASQSMQAMEQRSLVPHAKTHEQTPKTKPTVIWSCSGCQRECIPVREQSRCICGHRLKDHPAKELADGSVSLKCCNGKCTCPRFFFIVAEGAWILRCTCKHKHTDHDPRTHRCSKASCSCAKFFSPWVCNCDHPWAAHEQRVEHRRVKTIEDMVRELAVGGDDVKRTDLYAEPLRL